MTPAQLAGENDDAFEFEFPAAITTKAPRLRASLIALCIPLEQLP
jgi:hypothetical protein